MTSLTIVHAILKSMRPMLRRIGRWLIRRLSQFGVKRLSTYMDIRIEAFSDRRAKARRPRRMRWLKFRINNWVTARNWLEANAKQLTKRVVNMVDAIVTNEEGLPWNGPTESQRAFERT